MITANLEFKIEKTKDDYEIVKINKDNKWIYIGSKYNMKAEIDRFLEKIGENKDDQKIFLIYGFATGEHIKALKSKFPKNKILVFEPNEELEEYINNLEWVKEDELLEIIISQKDKILSVMKKNINELNLDDTKFIHFSNYDKVYIDEMRDFLIQIKNIYMGIIIENNTRIKFSVRWFETLIANLPFMIDAVPADLYEQKYKDIPAIIVSAGPSLEKNVDQLIKLNDEMLIISGGRTLKGLMEKNIKPHLLVVIDPGDKSYDLVKGYIEKTESPLLFFECTNEKVVMHHTGEKIFSSYASIISKVAGRRLQIIQSGGSVAHSMTSYAAIMGCNPIIFIGQDLAYTDEKSYSSISGNRDGSWKFDEVKREDDIWVESIYGNKVRTSLPLNEFRIAFEEIIEAFPNTKFINATEGGARIHGTIEMTLAEAIEKYKVEKVKPIKKIEYEVDMKKNAINALNETKKSGKIIIGKCKQALKYIDKLKISYIMKKGNEVNSILKKLDKIDKEIKDEYTDVDIVATLLYPILYEILKDKSIDTNNPNLEKIQFIIDQNKKLYSEILNQLEYALEYVDETIIKLENGE
ncbi:hypothetical protein CLPUN_21000 [Clostridium puniceum]|uniref:6-hydroxymethylpterin diphosphokinase MptE-like domain-containing protein n=1 Tax=Clostridium puniceum TaxID=29367 RepID=A0A1S8TJF9_9CLOT|nr:6-hydroxymethylpterin diphosphokinase MptE-like protein [Clostridium puniceum]OOM77927.1 hypothetical protein CLPUN_21000 [Clostridium puniceum]